MPATPAFHRGHFTPGYQLEVDPEFPPGGDWGVPVHAFDEDGRVVAEFVSRWGAPVSVRVGAGGAEWVGLFPAGGLGGVRGVFAGPAPELLCVVVAGLAQVVDVRAPGDGAVVVLDQVGQVVPVAGMSVLLLVTCTGIMAIGAAGVAWESGGLVPDGLRVLGAGADGIRCGDDLAGEFVLDPVTGRVTEGGTGCTS